jgi:hypothetical protein
MPFSRGYFTGGFLIVNFMKAKIIFDPEWMSMIEILNREQFFEFFMAFGHQLEVEQVSDPVVKGIYKYIKGQVDGNLSKYKDKTLTNRVNGSKGGRPTSAQKNPNKNPNNPNNRTVIIDNPNNRTVIDENPNNHNTIQDNTKQYNSLQDKTRQGRPPGSGKTPVLDKFKNLPSSIRDQYEHAAKGWLHKQGEDPNNETVTRIAATFYERNPDQYKEENLPIYLKNRIE